MISRKFTAVEAGEPEPLTEGCVGFPSTFRSLLVLRLSREGSCGQWSVAGNFDFMAEGESDGGHSHPVPSMTYQAVGSSGNAPVVASLVGRHRGRPAANL
jgi:hypothetical protein